jgi:sec-independent protein translocase protein TatC
MALIPFPGGSPAAGAPAPRDDDSWDDDANGEMAGARMSFLEHLEELRKRLIVAASALGVGFLLSFLFIDRIYAFVMRPLAMMLPPGNKMQYTEPTEAFVLYLKIAFLSGIVLAAPVILWQLWLFVAPGLYAKEKKFAVPFIVMGSVFFVLGAAFSHYMLFPWTWRFLASFSSEWVAFQPKIDATFSLYAKMLIGMGIIFQLPTLVFLLSKMGVVTARFLLRNFKYAFLLIFILAAVITPTGDPLTQTLFAAPMVALYLVSILIAWIFGKKPAKRESRA